MDPVALGFVLTTAAGLSTCIGGLVVFSKKMVYLANPISLSVALGVSCGVMLFISLVEILGESVSHFEESSHDMHDFDPETNSTTLCSSKCHGLAWSYATLSFLAGIAIIYMIDWLIDYIHPEHDHDLTADQLEELRISVTGETGLSSCTDGAYKPVSAVHNLQHTPAETSTSDTLHKKGLMRTGILTAIAIGIHNFPEGLATYIGAVKDTKLGVSLAIGIAIHNIPEGIAIAAPVYFATCNRWKAFLWTLLSALAEPFGALMAYIVFGDSMNSGITATLFGIVAGMMVCICIKEMIPTAWNYDPKGKYVSTSIFLGMVIMAVSLLLFAFAGIE